jgi:serine/threonine protein kinase
VCKHPSVVGFVGVTTDPLAIITELVDGPNLYDLIHDPAYKYNWKQLRLMAQESAAGIAHIHEKKIVHRDLKSLNLLVRYSPMQFVWLCFRRLISVGPI